MKLPVSFLGRGLLLAVLTLVAVPLACAADSFEGRVHMVVSSKGEKKAELDYAMKDGKLRINPLMPDRGDRGGGMDGMIMDMQAREMILLLDMHGQKMFMRRPMPQPGEQPAGPAHEGHPMSPPVATGRTEMIAGYEATEYRVTTERGDTVELWLAKGLGPFMSFSGGNPMGGRGAPSPGWESFVRDGNLFPLRVVTHNASGAEEGRMEVTHVEKTSLPDSLFSTDGYSEFQMPGFGGGFNPFKRN